MDECSVNNGQCEGFCVNYVGNYQCTCDLGKQVGPDGVTCQSEYIYIYIYIYI